MADASYAATYEEAVLLPVSSFLGACEEGAAAGGGGRIEAAAVDALAASIHQGGSSEPHWSQFLAGGGGGDGPEEAIRDEMIDALAGCCRGDATARGQALRSSALACLAAAHGLAPGLVEARIERGKDGGVLLDALRGDAAAVQVDPAGRDGPAPDFYANLTGSPIAFRTVKELEGELVAIDADLRKDSADQWKDRLEALRSLGQILAGGCVRSSPDLRRAFLASVRRMPIEEQLLDLRSQITRQACRLAVALAYEVREAGQDRSSTVAMAGLAEIWVPAILRLAISGVRLMAIQGTDCLHHLAALAGPYGYPRVLPALCSGCTGSSTHQNHRRACILALTAALRLWEGPCLVRHSAAIAKAISESAAHRNPAVREEGRKALWAMHSREEFRTIAESLLARMDAREVQRLRRVKADVDAEWSEGGRLERLVRTGVDDRGQSNNSLATTARGRPTPRKKKSALPSRAMRKAAVNKSTASGWAEDTVVAAKALKPVPSSKGTDCKTPRRPRSATRGRAPKSAAKSARKSATKSTRRSGVPTPSINRTPSRTGTPSRTRTPGTASRRTTPFRFTPSRQRLGRSMDEFVQMASAKEWSQREKAFTTLTAYLERDVALKEKGGSIDGNGNSFDVSTFVASASSTHQFTELLLDNILERNIRVSKSAMQCCGASLRHPEMRKTISLSLPLVVPTIFNVLAKYAKGGAATEKIHEAATGCLDSIVDFVGSEDTICLFSIVLANHNAGGSKNGENLASRYHALTDAGIQRLVDLLNSAIAAMGGGAAHQNLMSPSDKSILFSQLAKIASRHSDRSSGILQKAVRADDDKLKESVCILLMTLLDGAEVATTVRIFLSMARTDVDVLNHCMWTYGGEWGKHLRDDVVSGLECGAMSGKNTPKAKDDCIFGGDFANKPSNEQAELFDDLLSPKASDRTSEIDPVKALAEAVTPKSTQPLCDVQRRVLSERETCTHPDVESITEKSPLVLTKLTVEEEVAMPKASIVGSMRNPSSPLSLNANPAPSIVESPAGKTRSPTATNNPYEEAMKSLQKATLTPKEQKGPTKRTKTLESQPQSSTTLGEATLTPYESALRSLKKGKTSKLESSQVDSFPSNTCAIMESLERYSPSSPLVGKNLHKVSNEGNSTSDSLVKIMNGLADSSLPQDRYLMLQSLLRHAKERGDDSNWNKHFSGILNVLLNGCALHYNEPNAKDPFTSLPTNTDFSAKSDNIEVRKIETGADASRCLFLQSIRALIKYVPQYFENHVDIVVDKLLECCNCPSYELAHTAERSLENLVQEIDAKKCLSAFSRHLVAAAISKEDVPNDNTVVLMALRLLSKLVERIPKSDLKNVLPMLKSAIFASLGSSQVDMRKAAVFFIVELQMKFGQERLDELEDMNAAQQKLVCIYVEKRKQQKVEQSK